MKPVTDPVFPSNKKLSGWFSETAQKQPFSTSAWLEMDGTIEEIPARADYHFISSKGKRGEIPPGVKYAFSTNMFFNRQFPLGKELFYQLQVPGRDYYGTSDPIDLDLLSLDSPTIPDSDIPTNTTTVVNKDSSEPILPDISQTEAFHKYPQSQSILPMIDSISIFSSPPSPHSQPCEEEEIPIRMLLNASSDSIASETLISNPFYSLLSQRPLETLEDIFTNTQPDVSHDQDVEIIPMPTTSSLQPSESIEDVFIANSDLCFNENQIIESSVNSQTHPSDNILLLQSHLAIESLEDVINNSVPDTDLNTSDVQNVEIIPMPTTSSLQPSESIEDVFIATVSNSDLVFNENQIIESSVNSQTQPSDNLPVLQSQLPIESLEDVINNSVPDINLDASDVQNVEIIPFPAIPSLQPSESIEDVFIATVSNSDLRFNGDPIIEVCVKSQAQHTDDIPMLPSQLPIESLEDVINTTIPDTDLNTSDVQNLVINSQARVPTEHLESLQDIFVNTPSDTEVTRGNDLNVSVVDSTQSPNLLLLSSPEFFTPNIILPPESGLLVIDREHISPVGQYVSCPLQEESPLPPTPPTETISPIRDEFSPLSLLHKSVDLETTLNYFSVSELLFLEKFNQLPS